MKCARLVTVCLLGLAWAVGCESVDRSQRSEAAIHGSSGAEPVIIIRRSDLIARLDAAEDEITSTMESGPVQSSKYTPYVSAELYERWNQLVYLFRHAYRTANGAGIAPRKTGLRKYSRKSCEDRCAKQTGGLPICRVACDVPESLISEASDILLERIKQLKSVSPRGGNKCFAIKGEGEKLLLSEIQLSECPRVISNDIKFILASQGEKTVLLAREYIEKARSALESGSLDDLKKYTNQAEEIAPDHPAVPELKSALESRIEESKRAQAEECIQQVEAAIEAGDSGEAGRLLKEAEVKFPKHPKLAALKKRLEEAPSNTPEVPPEELLDQSEAAWKGKDYRKASELLVKADRMASGQKRCATLGKRIAVELLNNGRKLLQKRKFAEAEKMLASCLLITETLELSKMIMACAGMRKAAEVEINGPQEFDVKAVLGVLRSDMFAVFDELAKKYATQVDRQSFAGTDEAKAYKKKLMRLTSEVLAGTYLVRIGPIDEAFDPKKRLLTFVLDKSVSETETEWPLRRKLVNGCVFRGLNLTLAEEYKPDGEMFLVQKLQFKVPGNQVGLVGGRAKELVAELLFQVKKNVVKGKTSSSGDGPEAPAYYPEARNIRVRLKDVKTGKVYQLARIK